MFLMGGIDDLIRASIYLAKPSGEILGCLDEYINEQSCKLVRGLNQQQELSFTIQSNLNDWYEYIQEGMYLYLEKDGLFRITQPTIECSGVNEVKTVIAKSCDVELEDKNLQFEINMGTKTSLENIITYNHPYEDEDIINPYTGIPYDWIVIYNTFPEQLENHMREIDNGVYGNAAKNHNEAIITDSELIEKLQSLFNLIPRLKNRFIKIGNEDPYDYELEEFAIVSYGNDGETVTSITLDSSYYNRVVYLKGFYTSHRDSLSLLSLVLEKTGGTWTVGDVYGVSDGDYTIANKKYQFEVSENIYSFLSTSLAQASECMVLFDILSRKVSIVPVDKIGSDTGLIISYDNLLNTLNIEPNENNLITRLYMYGDDDLSISQVNFGLDYIDDLSYKVNATDSNGNRIFVSDELALKYSNFVDYRETLRDEYIEIAKRYSGYIQRIDDIKYRVPLDDLKNDWGTFSLEELEISLSNFKNLMAALISMYRTDYYPQGINPDDSVNETFMKSTMYWFDYDAYKSVIKEIECAISTFPYYSDQTKWSDYNIQLYKDAITAWETDWSLYGTIELQGKIDSYKSNMDILAESSVIKTSDDSDTIKTWSELTADEKASFGDIENNYQYDVYMDYYNNMVDAKAYLATLLSQIEDIEADIEADNSRKLEIVDAVSYENNFTADEIKILSLLLKDSDCVNNNILVTTIDTVDKKYETMLELLEYGQEQLSKLSRPQLHFTVSSDNLLELIDYQEIKSNFVVGNYILVQYKDDTYVKVRLIGYSYNPFLPSSDSFEITFSNYVRSKVEVSDLENLLGLASSTSSDGLSGSSRGGKGSGYGSSDDIDVTLSNTMLAKLLNSETFGTRVKDVVLNTIDVNSITARYATFNGLANGVTTIDGQCITTGWINSIDYNGVDGSVDNTAGSILNLNTGNFNFGGGSIKYVNDTLKVTGAITAESLSTGGRMSSATGHNGLFIDSDGNLYSGSNNGVILYNNGQFNLANKITYNGSIVSIAGDVVIGGSDSASQIITNITNAQATADSKTHVFYGSPNDTYSGVSIGDYLIDKSDGCTYKWTGTDWDKLTDYSSAITTSINALNESLTTQLDNKIDTWAQSTDPSSSWTAEDKPKHDKDLWYYTGTSIIQVNEVNIEPSKTYQYNATTNKWMSYNNPSKSLFDYVDGKSTIYYGKKTDTFQNVETNDYLVDKSDGCTYRWTGTDWDKLTDYSNAISTAITALNDSLTTQLDNKIDTWVQSTAPSSLWTDADEKSKHNGDLWYYTGTSEITVNEVKIKPSNTYQYNSSTNKWVSYNNPSKSLFDYVDGKSTIYYGKKADHTTGIEEGDYLVDSSDGCTYRWDDTQKKWVEVTNYSKAITDAINELDDAITAQLDNKIDTWAQSTDPSSSWTAEDKPKHDKDLWYYTGTSIIQVNEVNIEPSNTYQYNSSTNKWVSYNNPSVSLFDYVDGKSTIYYGKKADHTTGIEEGDYLVDSSDGCTYRWDDKQKKWVEVTKTGTLYATCSTDASTAAKVAQCSKVVSLYEGLVVSVKFANANTATSALTLKVGSLATKNIQVGNDNTSSTNKMLWAAGATITFIYNGEKWLFADQPQTYNASCAAAANTTAKSSSVSNAVVVNGTTVNVTFTYSNTASNATLDITNTSANAASISANGTSLSATSQYNWNAGATASFTFDGTKWLMNNTSALYNTNSYMKFESSGKAPGLMIANMTGGVVGNSSILSRNVLLQSDGLKIRNGQDVVASYGDTIVLYKPGTDVKAVEITENTASFTGTVTATSGSFTGDITANSLTLGSGVTIPYGNISSTPDLTVYIQQDGKLGTLPSNVPSGTYSDTGFKVSKDGLLVASNAVIYGTIYASDGEFTGKITATSLDLVSNNVKIPYGSISDTPDLKVYIKKDGTIGTLPATGATSSSDTGFMVSQDGLLQASNAIIYGTIYASKGKFTGDIVAKSLDLTTNNVQIPYSSVSNTPDLKVYIKKDGTIGTLPEQGATSSTTTGFQVSTDGLLQASNALIYGKIYASAGKFTGEITANSGYIGGTSGWVITDKKIYSGTKDSGTSAGDVTLSTADFTRVINNTSRTTLRFAIGSKFGVTNSGTLYAHDLIATGGSIGGFTIKSGYLTTNTSRTTYNSTLAAGITIDGNGIGGYGSASAYFTMTTGGVLTCSGATVIGTITANTGYIGGTSGWIIASQKIYSGNDTASENDAGCVTLSTLDFTRKIDGISRDSLRFAIGSKFGVASDGTIYAGSGVFSGTVKATTLFTGTKKSSDSGVGTYIDSNGAIYSGSGSNNYFTVTKNGEFTLGNTSNGIRFINKLIKIYDDYGRFYWEYKDCIDIGNNMTVRLDNGDVFVSNSEHFSFDDGLISYGNIIASNKRDSSKGTIRATSGLFVGSGTDSYGTGSGQYVFHVDTAGNIKCASVNVNGYGVATQNWVQNQGYLTSHQSLSSYATQNWVKNQGYLTSHQSLSSYATQNWVQSQGYLTSHQSLANYVKSNTGAGHKVTKLGSRSGYVLVVDGSFGSTTDILSGRFEGVADSDYRLKKNIIDSDYKAIDIFKQMKPVQFNWKSDDKHETLGYIAQDLEKLDPKLVLPPDGDDDYYAISTNRLCMVTSKAVKELIDEIDTLKLRITELEEAKEK